MTISNEIPEFRLKDCIVYNPHNVDIDRFEFYYTSLKGDIDELPLIRDDMYLCQGDTHLQKIREWYKHACGVDNYYGLFVDRDFPWVNNINPIDNTFEEYFASFIDGMKDTLQTLLLRWEIALGHPPQLD